MEIESERLQQVERLEELKAKVKRNVDIHQAEVEKLESKLTEAKVNFEVEKVKREIFSDKKDRLQKNC